MRFEVTKHNYTKVSEEFKDVTGINFGSGNAFYSGVTKIEAELDRIPFYENGLANTDGEEYIIIKLCFEDNGATYIRFCPDREHCEITKESDNLWEFNIQDIPDYVNNNMYELDYKFRVYEEYMNS